MKISKKLLVAASALTVLGAVTIGTTSTFAQNTNDQSFVQQLAQKLGIDQSKVQTAMDQIRQDKKSQMEQNFQSKLDQLVQQGKITEVQKQAILNKLAELKTKYNPDSLEDKTPQERKQAMQDMQAELKSWAQAQGIDLSLIKPNFGMRGKGMHMGGWFKGSPNPSTSPTPTPSTTPSSSPSS